MSTSKSSRVKPKYRRVLLKLSGESMLNGLGENLGVDFDTVQNVCASIIEIVKSGVQVAIVIGGGNLFRGAELVEKGFPQITGDYLGMLATVMNGLMLRAFFLQQDARAEVLSSLEIPGVVEIFSQEKAIDYLEDGRIVIFVGGTGNPLFTTDSAASLRSIEIGADVLLKATKVDGVYSADPKKVKNVERFTRLSYQDVLDRRLMVMDLTAICLCQAHNMAIRVFDMRKKGVLKRIIFGEDEGTLVCA